MANWRPIGLALMVAVTLLGGFWGHAEAQMVPTTAEVISAMGQVEVARKGQSQWVAIGVGGKLVEGDHIRALVRSSAELKFADGSTVLVAENTRFVVVKTNYDGSTGGRNMAGHLVAGKIRAQVAKAGVQLVAARQSGFNISTPNGVAAVRGTILIVAFNPITGQTLTAAFPSPGQAAGQALVSYISQAGQVVTFQGNQLVNQAGGGAPGAPAGVNTLSPAALAALQSAANAATAGHPSLTIAVVTPNFEQLEQLLEALGIEAVIGPPGFANFSDTPGNSGIGRDISSCASPPCN